MTQKLNSTRVAFVVANEGIEEVELAEPWKAVEEAGGGHLPRAVDTGGRRPGAGPNTDLLAQPADRYSQRRRHLGGSGGRGLHHRAEHTRDRPKADDLPAFNREMLKAFAGLPVSARRD